jgi:nitrogen fixation NifU-like protein
MTQNRYKSLELARNTDKKASKGYSASTFDLYNQRYMVDLNEYNAFDILTGPCGHRIAFWLNVKDGIIDDICFNTDGSTYSRTVCSMTAELAKGKTLAEARKISRQNILDAMRGLRKSSQPCALLASNTLKKAIDDYRRYLRLKREFIVGIEAR